MSSIIRSPAISGRKHKLTPRGTRMQEEQAAESVSSVSAVHAGDAAEQTDSANNLKDVVEQARKSVLAQFKEEAEAARELGRQRGLREGRLTGIEESKQSFSAKIDRVRSLADKLPHALRAGIDGMEDTLVEIAFEAVCKVLGNAAVTRESVLAMVRQATARTLSGEKLVVRLHPTDLAMLRTAGALAADLPTGAAASWVADQRITLGGCVIETDGGELDARLETQIQRLRDALVTARRNVADLSRDVPSTEG